MKVQRGLSVDHFGSRLTLSTELIVKKFSYTSLTSLAKGRVSRLLLEIERGEQLVFEASKGKFPGGKRQRAGTSVRKGKTSAELEYLPLDRRRSLAY